MNGCCLTVVELGDGWWAADAVTETLDRTALGALDRGRPGEPRTARYGWPTASAATSCRATSTASGTSPPARRSPTARRASRSRRRPTSLRYVVEKGSITVDGISLTVAALGDDRFDVAVIPHTLAVTTLGPKGPAIGRQPRGRRARQVRRALLVSTVPRRELTMPFTQIENAIAAIARGEIVIVVDDADRENEGDLIMAAEKITPEAMGFMVRHTSGVICMPLEGERLDELAAAADGARQHRGAAHRVHRLGRRRARARPPGISAADRADDGARARSTRTTRPDDFARPGHIFPLRYREGGVLKRAGHTEAAVDLARLAGLSPGRRAAPRW